MRFSVSEFVLRLLCVSYVNRETSGIYEFAIDEANARRNQHVTDRPVLGAQASRVFVEFFASFETAEDVGYCSSVCMKLGDITTYILLRRIAEHIEFGLVGAQDGAIGAYKMQPDRAILEKIFQIAPWIGAAGDPGREWNNFARYYTFTHSRISWPVALNSHAL
jgi:hypothetical protein